MNTYHVDIHWVWGNAGTDTLAEHTFNADNWDAARSEAKRLMRQRPEQPYELEAELNRIHDDGDLELIGLVRPW